MNTIKKIIKNQTITASKATGTTAGTYTFEEQLDENFDEVIGVEAYETSGTAENYQLAIRDNVDTYHDAANKNALLTGKDVGQKDKSRPINIPVKGGRKTKVDLVIDATTTADIEVDVVFVLAKYLQEK